MIQNEKYISWFNISIIVIVKWTERIQNEQKKIKLSITILHKG